MSQETVSVQVEGQIAEVKLVTAAALLAPQSDVKSRLPCNPGALPCIPQCNPACVPVMLPSPCFPELIKECMPKLIPPPTPRP